LNIPMSTALKSKEITGSELATERVIPFPKKPGKSVPDRIRPELNLEKWPIWKPAKSKNPPTRKVITREIPLPNGNKIAAEVEVGFTDRGELNTEDQKTYYALVKHWEENDRPDEQTYFSVRQVAKRLGKGWGTNVIDSVTESLFRLRGVLITWTNSYYDASTKETAEVLDTFNILSELKIIKRKKDGVVNREVGYFRFNDFILKNLLANHTKPVLLDTVLGFKSEIAQILYTYLDLILADKTFYERRTRELFEDLNLQGKAYRNLSDRKRTLERAIKELTGAPLTTGRIVSATLEQTADGKDYKIVIRKGKLVALPRINHYQEDQTSEPSTDQEPAEGREAKATEPPQEQRSNHEQLLSQARELVVYFYEVFQSGKNFQIQSKPLNQAISLITQYGFEEAKYIIDFAHREAPKTNYDIQTFGGIIQYSSRALAEYEHRRADQRQTQQSREAIEACDLCDQYGMRPLGENTVKRCTHDQATEEAAAREFAETERQQQEEQRQEAEADQRAGQYLDQLPPEEYQALFAQVQAEALKQYPSLKRMPDDTRQQMIRRLMIRKIRAKQGYETARETHQTGSNEPQDAASDQPIG
jgi:hypothetical protein